MYSTQSRSMWNFHHNTQTVLDVGVSTDAEGRVDAAEAIDKTRQSSSPSESSHKDRTRTRDK